MESDQGGGWVAAGEAAEKVAVAAYELAGMPALAGWAAGVVAISAAWWWRRSSRRRATKAARRFLGASYASLLSTPLTTTVWRWRRTWSMLSYVWGLLSYQLLILIAFGWYVG